MLTGMEVPRSPGGRVFQQAGVFSEARLCDDYCGEVPSGEAPFSCSSISSPRVSSISKEKRTLASSLPLSSK
jgi:hypothetical protein